MSVKLDFDNIDNIVINMAGIYIWKKNNKYINLSPVKYIFVCDIILIIINGYH